MKLTTKHLHGALLASTALVAAGFLSTASAQSTISDEGVIDVAAGLDGFIAATSQLGDAADFSAEVEGAEQSVDLTSTDPITENQTVFGNDVLADTRLNQTTATVEVAAPESGGTFTGATAIDSTDANPDVSIDAGIGILSQQRVTDSGDITATVGADGAAVENSITLDSPTVSGDLVVGGNQTVADALANDAMNTINATAGGTGNINVPVAIASLQTFTPDGDGTDVSASAFGDMTVTLEAAAGALSSDDVRLDENVVGARAGVNTAMNDLFAGNTNGGGTAQGGLEGTLSATALDTSGEIDSFIADFAVASLQVIDSGSDGTDDTFANIAATTDGNVALGLDAGTAVTSDTLTARGNTILSDAAGNDATNRAIITTDGVNGVSVGVASAQEITGDPALTPVNTDQDTFDVSAFTTGAVTMESSTAGTAGGTLADAAVDISGNRIGAEATANRALNVAAVNSTGSLDGSTSYVAGRQTATGVDVGAVVDSADVIANFAEITDDTGTSTAVLNNNEVFAVAALNTQTNVLQNNGSSAFGASTMVGTSRQEISGGSVSADVIASAISLTGAGASDAVSTLSNNSVLASATGNVSTTTITNRSSSFSFSR